MDDGDGTVFLFDFYGALETDRADRAEDHCPRSGDQSESGSDQTDGQGQTMSSANFLRSSSVRGSSSEAGSSAAPSD